VGVRYQGAFELFELEDIVHEQLSLLHRLQCNVMQQMGRDGILDCGDVWCRMVCGAWISKVTNGRCGLVVECLPSCLSLSNVLFI
jgi:hypothetical protein